MLFAPGLQILKKTTQFQTYMRIIGGACGGGKLRAAIGSGSILAREQSPKRQRVAFARKMPVRTNAHALALGARNANCNRDCAKNIAIRTWDESVSGGSGVPEGV
jgi:hypothetical protein